MTKHIPVLINEVLKELEIKKNGIYVDLTLGRAGHAAKILELIPKGKLIGFDKDIIAINESNSRLNQIANNFHLIHSDFRNLKLEMKKLGINKVDGILADLGVSSPQIDLPERGFSYSKNGILDMRMDQSQILSAKEIVNNWSFEQLVEIFKNYADVKLPQKIANAIIKNRPITTTEQLVTIIKEALPAKILRAKNPAKTVFQAIRIAVNDEFGALKILLKDAIDLLKSDGNLAIISFHSLEDKIVKEFFGNLLKSKIDFKMPIQEIKQFQVKVIKPSTLEISNNPRSRSAKLRILKKLY